jgi:hypothetical protein
MRGGAEASGGGYITRFDTCKRLTNCRGLITPGLGWAGVAHHHHPSPAAGAAASKTPVSFSTQHWDTSLSLPSDRPHFFPQVPTRALPPPPLLFHIGDHREAPLFCAGGAPVLPHLARDTFPTTGPSGSTLRLLRSISRASHNMVYPSYKAYWCQMISIYISLAYVRADMHDSTIISR